MVKVDAPGSTIDLIQLVSDLTVLNEILPTKTPLSLGYQGLMGKESQFCQKLSQESARLVSKMGFCPERCGQ